MTRTGFAAAALGFTLFLAADPAAAQRPARCVIQSEGSATYRGPCLFRAERGGTFTVMPPRGRAFPGGVTSVTVAVIGRGVADVRGLTRGGINSRWGEAIRSQSDGACWQGNGFRVCAY
jgi:hypothetical protein